MAERVPSDRPSRDGGEIRRRPASLRMLQRSLLWTTLVVAGGLAAVLIFAWFMVCTAPGARLALRQMQRLGIPVTVEELDGRLSGPLELRGLKVSSSNFVLEVDSLELEWAASELLLDRWVHVENLTAVGVKLRLSSKEESTPADERNPTDRGTARLRLPLDVFADRVRIEKVDAALPGDVRVRHGRLTLVGHARDYRLEGTGRISTPRLQWSNFHIVASGNLNSLKSARARVDLPAGSVAVSGAFTWYPSSRWRGQLDARDVDVSTFLTDSSRWPGRLQLRARADGELTAQGLVARVRVDTVHGTLRDQRLAGHASLDLDPDRIEVANLNFQWGAAHLGARGAVSESLDLEVDLEVPDLSLASSLTSGALQLTGRVTGPTSAPVVRARFTGRDIRFAQGRFGRINGDGRVGLGGADSVRLSVNVSDASLLGRAVDTLAIEVEGTRAEHRLSLGLRVDETELDLAAAGGIVRSDKADSGDGSAGESAWRGQLQRLELQDQHAGDWVLEDEGAGIVAAMDRIALLRELCLTSSGSRLCISGAWHSEAPWSAAASIDALPLALSEPFLPGGWSLSGELEGAVRANAGEDGETQLQAALRSGAGRVGFPAGATNAGVRYERGALGVVTDSAGLLASLDFALAGSDGDSAGRVHARIEMPGYRNRFAPAQTQRLAGSAAVRLRNLEPLEALAPGLERLRGSLALDVKVDGTVGSPAVVGEVKLSDGAVDVPMLGLELRELGLSATGDPDGRIEFEGGFRSGESRLNVRGDSHLVPSPDAPSRLHIDGERVLAVNTERARIEASPRIEMEFDGDLLQVNGEVVVDTADIRLGEAEAVVKTSPDVVYADSAADDKIAMAARVRVSLGGPVRVEGFGFAGAMSGAVLVNEDPGEPTRGSGELVIEEGTYSAFGQTLTIEQGRLIFAGGPLDNPGLDIRATRTAGDVIAGMQVTGSAKTPLVTLYSEPPLPQDRIAVILATGGALQGKGGSSGSVLESASSKLGIKGASVLVRQIAAELNLEEARIEKGGSLREASLVAGKYLSPRLYVKYGLNLVDPLRMLQLRYMLSSKWTLAAETGEQGGFDLLYRIETGI